MGCKSSDVKSLNNDNIQQPDTVARKVLIVAYVFPPIAYAGTYRSLRFCRYLPRLGWEPSVLTIQEQSDLDNDYQLLDLLPGSVAINRTPTLDPWRWYRARSASRNKGGEPSSKTSVGGETDGLQSPNQGGVLRKLLSAFKALLLGCITIPDHMIFWVPFAVWGGARFCRKKEPDLIYTSSPPHSEHLIGLILSKLFRKPWVADFRDPMLDSSGYAPSRARRWIDAQLERIIIKNANRVLIISEAYCAKMLQRYPTLAEKFRVLPNGFDPEVYDSVEAERYEKFTIVYTGSFYAKRSPELFLRGFAKWVDLISEEERKNIAVEFFGPVSPLATRIVEEEKLEGYVHQGGYIPQTEAIRKQKGAGLLLLIIGFDIESQGTLTSKVFEYMACERPILAIMPEGDASEVLNAHTASVHWVNAASTNLVAKCLAKAYSEWTHCSPQGNTMNQTRKESAFDARVQTRFLAEVFLEALGYKYQVEEESVKVAVVGKE